MIRPPPRSTPFPSTTLFRSLTNPPLLFLKSHHNIGPVRPARLVRPFPSFITSPTTVFQEQPFHRLTELLWHGQKPALDRKSTRLNSSHANISYAVFCLTKNL